MARHESRKPVFTLFLISLLLHLFVFAASSHEYIWKKTVRTSRPLKFRVISVEKPAEKIPPNPQSRFLSNANRKESGSGKSGKTPVLKREDRDLIPSRKGGDSPGRAFVPPAPKSRVPVPSLSPVRPPATPVVVKPKPDPERAEKSRAVHSPEISGTTETPGPQETANLATKPRPSVKTPSATIEEKKKARPTADKMPEMKKTETKTIPKGKTRPVFREKTVMETARKKPRAENERIEAKKKNREKIQMAALPPPVVIPEPRPEKARKSKDVDPPETSETAETPKPAETVNPAATPGSSVKTPLSVVQEKVQRKEKRLAGTIPEMKGIEDKAISNKLPVPRQAARKKTMNPVAREKRRNENRKVEARKKTREKVELSALKPVSPPVRARRPTPGQPQPKDPLALFRAKPRSRGKSDAPNFALSDQEADRIAKRSLAKKDQNKEEGETISLDTRDFQYASYFAHIRRRIQNAWIWPAEAQNNRGKLLLGFKLRQDGTLEEVRLIRSAGIRILDDLAIAAVTKAAPFEPFPAGLERKPITATFVYE